MDKNKTKAELFDELHELRRRNTELEKFQIQHSREKKKLQESKNIYKSIFESFYDVYYRTDKEGLITLISPSIRTQAGYDPKDVIGHPVTDFYHIPQDREAFIEKLKESGSINDYETQLLAKDGRVINVSISSRILVGKDGTPQGIEGILRDITERKKTEEELKESEEKFRKAFDFAVIGKAMAKPGGKFIKVNASFCRMLGYSEEELLSISWPQITHPDYLNEANEKIKNLLKRKTFYESIEKKLIHKDGHHVWVHATIVMPRDKEGKPLYMIGDIQDISEQKKIEADQFLINELNNALNTGKSLQEIIQTTAALT